MAAEAAAQEEKIRKLVVGSDLSAEDLEEVLQCERDGAQCCCTARCGRKHEKHGPVRRDRGVSLLNYLQTLPEEERRAVCSRLQVIPSVRYCNDPKRENMPGYVFLYNGKRHIMSGQRTNGKYLLALGDKKTNYRADHCRVIRMGGLVYV